MTTRATERDTRTALLDSQRRVLERIASGAPLAETLETLVRLIEEQSDGKHCAVLLADSAQRSLRFVAAPSMSKDFIEAVSAFLTIGPKETGTGVCGVAAFERKPVYVNDMLTDPTWGRFGQIVVRRGFRAIWSTPILGDDNAVLGTFTMNCSVPSMPSPEHIQLIDMATQMARVAIEARRGDELLQTIFKSAPSGIAIADLAGKIVCVNPAFALLVGYTEEEMQGKSIAELTHEEDYPQNKALIESLCSRQRERFVVDKRYRRKDGKTVWAHITVALLRGFMDEPRYMIALVENITERRHAEDELTLLAAELHALSRRLVELQESERRELARELHDQIGQNLTALNINLSILSSSLPPQANDELRARLADSEALVESTTAAIGNVMSDLRPPMLDDQGLLPALKWYAKQFSTRTGVAVEVRSVDADERPAPERAIALFRIAQEALNNVVKHASASRVEINLERAGAEHVMSVQDNGTGFDVAEKRASPRPGLGLITMRERAQAVGGRLEVQTVRGSGTRLTVRVAA